MVSFVADLFDAVRVRLAEVPQEWLGEYVVPKRLLGITRASKTVPVGRAWHLGALLVTGDAVLATGEIVRARDPGRRGYPAQSQRDRAELAASALRGGFPEGAIVHLDWRPLDLDELAAGTPQPPLALIDGAPSIRWSTTGGYAPLADYLDERVALAQHPPERA